MNYNENAYYSEKTNVNIEARTYNFILGACVVWGLFANFIICKYFTDVALNMNPLVLIIGYIVLAFAGILISRKSDSALISFIGYNMVVIPVGLVLSISVYAYGGINSDVVTNAFMCTMIITALMLVAGTLFPDKFIKLGNVLGIALLCILVSSIVFLFIRTDSIITSWLCAVVFSLYIGYDIAKANKKAFTADNAVDSAVDLYLDIINLFLRLLRILGRSSSSRD